MNITAAKTFLQVLESGSLKRAAERLHVTQSTVTTRLDALERSLGQKLLVRSKSGTELTSAGFKFQRHAEMLVQTWDLARHEIALPKDFEGVANIGCHAELWRGVGQRWYESLRAAHPEIALTIWSGETTDLARWLTSGLIDIALTFETSAREGWSVRPLFEDQLIQVSSVRRSVQRWDPDYVYVDMGPEFRRQHAKAYPVEETPALTFSHSAWALEHIIRWGGSGYLPKRVAQPALDAEQVFLVEGAPAFTRTCYLACNTAIVGSWNWFEPSVDVLGSALSQC